MQTNQTNAGFIIRDEIWSQTIREEFKPWIFGQSHVMWVTDFPDGTTHTIPTTGRMPVRDYTEGDEVTTEDATLGEIQLTIDNYKQSGFNVTDKMMQDSYAIGRYIAIQQVDVGVRLREQLEADVFNTIHSDTTNGHTIGDPNVVSGQDTRWVATIGQASTGDDSMSYLDISRAKRVFDKLNVPYPRYAFIDPIPAESLLAQTDYSVTPLAQDVYGANSFVKEGFSNNMVLGKFYGFILYMTNFLPTQAEETITPTGGTADTVTTATVNQFFGPEAIYGALRQTIEVESWRQSERKQHVYHATMRYGLRVYRPESLIAVLTT